MREDTDNVELLNAFFASVFNANAAAQESQTLEVRVNSAERKHRILEGQFSITTYSALLQKAYF